jgi:hypothetical protein
MSFAPCPVFAWTYVIKTNGSIFQSFRKEKEETKMSENQKKILEMLANKKISVDEAYRLLSALKSEAPAPEGAGGTETTSKPKAKYLHVSVVPRQGHKHEGHKHEGHEDEGDEDEGDEDGRHEHEEHAEVVNVRVPMSLIRSGMKFTSLLPAEARDKVNDALHEKGMNLDMRNMKPEDLEELIGALDDLEVNVENDEETVRVFVE